ncbi:hypothetical protein BDR04DRAFT_823475 [Suillus decipiens]|nr:hypothetical protein BDR04DRAFT_823475 [Suillus decipiens]
MTICNTAPALQRQSNLPGFFNALKPSRFEMLRQGSNVDVIVRRGNGILSANISVINIPATSWRWSLSSASYIERLTTRPVWKSPLRSRFDIKRQMLDSRTIGGAGTCMSVPGPCIGVAVAKPH